MTKHRISKRKPDIRIGVGLILVGLVALTGAGRAPEKRTAIEGTQLRAPSGSITPGIAQAGVDTLDLQLD
jgi:hypothetical protein